MTYSRSCAAAAILLCCLLAALQPLWAMAPHRVDVVLAQVEPGTGFNGPLTSKAGKDLYLADRPSLDGADLASVDVVTTVPDQGVIELALNKAGSAKMARVAKENPGGWMAVVLDGEVLSAVKIGLLKDARKIVLEALPLKDSQAISTAIKDCILAHSHPDAAKTPS